MIVKTVRCQIQNAISLKCFHLFNLQFILPLHSFSHNTLVAPLPIVRDVGEDYTIPLFISPQSAVWRDPYAVCFIASMAWRILVSYLTGGSGFVLAWCFLTISFELCTSSCWNTTSVTGVTFRVCIFGAHSIGLPFTGDANFGHKVKMTPSFSTELTIVVLHPVHNEWADTLKFCRHFYFHLC